MDIINLIGEATEYDKKQKLEEKKPKSWCKSISAFANGIGGGLIFAIADNDTIVGAYFNRTRYNTSRNDE